MALALGELGHELRLFGKFDRSGRWADYDLTGAGGSSRRVQTARFVMSNLAAVSSQRPDHVICTHVNFGPAALVAKRVFGSSYTLVAHGIDVHQRLPRRTVAALRAADRIIAVSGWTRARVLELGDIEPDNVAVIPNAIDESRFTVGPKPELLRQKYALRDDEKVILTVARLDDRESYKGYDRIIEALPAIKRNCGPVRFLIAGTGSDLDRVAALARDRGVDSSVTFAGFVPPEDLVDHYRVADVFAMPSTGEGFGIVFVESMACGTPVIGGNADGSVDALDGGRLGRLIDPTNVDAIASAVGDILCRRGPALWFDREALHDAVVAKFGRAAFRDRLSEILLP